MQNQVKNGSSWLEQSGDANGNTQVVPASQSYTLASGVVTNGTQSAVQIGPWDGALSLILSNGAGSCTVTLQGADDGFATAQSAQNVGLQLLSSNNNGTPTCNTSRSALVNGVVNVLANSNYKYQIQDIYSSYRVVISNESGLGAGANGVNGLNAQLNAVAT